METISNFFGIDSPIFALSRLTKSWRTTLIGMVLIATALVSVFLPQTAQYATWDRVWLPIVIGLSLCFASPKRTPRTPRTPKLPQIERPKEIETQKQS